MAFDYNNGILHASTASEVFSASDLSICGIAVYNLGSGGSCLLEDLSSNDIFSYKANADGTNGSGYFDVKIRVHGGVKVQTLSASGEVFIYTK